MIDKLQPVIDEFVETYKYKNKIVDGIEYDVTTYDVGDDGMFITISLHDEEETLGSILYYKNEVVVSEYFMAGYTH